MIQHEEGKRRRDVKVIRDEAICEGLLETEAFKGQMYFLHLLAQGILVQNRSLQKKLKKKILSLPLDYQALKGNAFSALTKHLRHFRLKHFNRNRKDKQVLRSFQRIIIFIDFASDLVTKKNCGITSI